MKRFSCFACSMLMLATAATGSATETSVEKSTSPTQDELFTTVSKLDADLFDTFNHCDSLDQLQKHASYFAPNVEFYHDKEGVTWSRRDYIENTRNHVCGQFQRELIPASLQIFPIGNYGAIEQGEQKFCWIKSGKCFGEAQFLILWHHLDNRWIVTRVFSYGHLPIE